MLIYSSPKICDELFKIKRIKTIEIIKIPIKLSANISIFNFLVTNYHKQKLHPGNQILIEMLKTVSFKVVM